MRPPVVAVCVANARAQVVRSASELKDNFERATSEAKAAFGDGSVFIEKFIERCVPVPVARPPGSALLTERRPCARGYRRPGRATSRCKSWATSTATWSTSTSATAPCSAATKRSAVGRSPGSGRQAPAEGRVLTPRRDRARLIGRVAAGGRGGAGPEPGPRGAGAAAGGRRAPVQARRLLQRRHRRVPGRRGRPALLYRGERAPPGRAHCDGRDHRRRPGAVPDPHRRRSSWAPRRASAQRGGDRASRVPSALGTYAAPPRQGTRCRTWA